MSERWLWSWRSSASSAFVWSESSLGGGGTAISVAEPRTHGFHCATCAPSDGGAAAAQVEAETRAASSRPAAVTENRCFIVFLLRDKSGNPRLFAPQLASRSPTAEIFGARGCLLS